jgi:hypothetical protein
MWNVESLRSTRRARGAVPARCSIRPLFSPAQPRHAKTCRSTGKAAASEEARRYVPHFVWAVRPKMDPGERKTPFTISILRPALPKVEPLSEVRTPLGERCVLAHQGWEGEKSDFFSILVEAVGVMGVRQSITIMSAGGGSERGGRCLAIGMDGRPVRLHLVDGNVMGREFSCVGTCLISNDAPRNNLGGIRQGESTSKMSKSRA